MELKYLKHIKNLKNSIIKITQFKNRRRTYIDIFPKKIYKWSITHKEILNIISHREIQTKITTSYHFTPTRMAIIKKSDNTD